MEAAYEKKHPPELDDEVWRLDSIRKNGKFHKHLILLNISTVEQFLRFETMQPGKLRQVSPSPAIVHLLFGIVTCTVSSFLSLASSFLVCLQDMDLTNFSVEFQGQDLVFAKSQVMHKVLKRLVAWSLGQKLEMPSKNWEATVKHAQTCQFGFKQHIYRPRSNLSIIFNNIFQLVAIIKNQSTHRAADSLTPKEKVQTQRISHCCYFNLEFNLSMHEDFSVSSSLQGSKNDIVLDLANGSFTWFTWFFNLVYVRLNHCAVQCSSDEWWVGLTHR